LSPGDILGYLFVGALLASFAFALFRMRPRAPYLLVAAGLLAVELAMRALSPILFPRDAPAGLTYARNPAVQSEEDLLWPNRILIFLVTAAALWLLCRPQRRGLWVGIGLALVTAGGWPNLLEPLMRGYTTDYIALGPLVLNLADLCLVLGVPLLVAAVVVGEIRGRAEWLGKG
jgi:hypothetical protein